MITVFQDILGWGENDRGVSYTFGRDVVQDMLETLGISLICRAHQVCMHAHICMCAAYACMVDCAIW